jgi:hypothetical protein
MKKEEDLYWTLVVECLTKVFRMDLSTSKREAKKYRKYFDDMARDLQIPNIIYHDSPFDVACDLARVMPTEDKRKEFDEVARTVPTGGLVTFWTETKRRPQTRKVRETSIKGAYKSSSKSSTRRTKSNTIQD